MRDPYDHPTFDDLEPEGDVENALGDALGEGAPFELPLQDIEDDPLGEMHVHLEHEPRAEPARRPKRRKAPDAPVSVRERPDVRRVQREQAARFNAEQDAYEDDFGKDLLDADAVSDEDDVDMPLVAPRDLRAAGLKEDAALLKALSRQLERSRNAADALGLVGAMVPVAFRAHPHVYSGLWQLTPDLVTELTRVALRQPHLTRTLPILVERVAARLARSARQGRQPTVSHVKNVVRLELRARTRLGKRRRR